MPFPTRLGPTNLSTTTASWYSVPGPLRLTEIVLTNWDGVDATVNLYLVPSGSTYGNTNKILGDQTVPANDVIRLDRFNLVLTAGDALWAYASTSGVNAVATLSDEKPPH